MSASIEKLARALEFLDAARAAPNGIETGAMRDAREWLEEAAREVIAGHRKLGAAQYSDIISDGGLDMRDRHRCAKTDAVTEYYTDRANSPHGH
ncbi:hypothetical protein ACF8C6_08930 [Pseudomonas sp. zbq_18]|uniref:hypothetical protein n=1 Tax=Pseudomonas sp. zbq_18 TaxID=3367251 RepID=UPI00370A2F6B